MGDPDLCERLADQPAAVELGTGGREYEPLENGDNLVIHQGFGGGYFVFGSWQAYGLHPGTELRGEGNPSVRLELAVEERNFLASMEVEAPLTEGTDGSASRVGQPLVLTHFREEAVALDGQAGVFSLRVGDQCGRQADDSVRVELTVDLPTD